MKKFKSIINIFFLVTFFYSLNPSSEAQEFHNPSQVDFDEIKQNVVVSNKSFKRLTRIRFGATIRILDYRYWHTVPGGLKRAYEFRDQLHGVYMEALCGSYEETKKMAIIKNLKNRLITRLTKNTVAPYQLICKCEDGRVLVYSSPHRINFWDVIDPDWDYEG